MRKMYLAMLAVSISASLFAQDRAATSKEKYQAATPNRTLGTAVQKNANQGNSSQSTILWTDDFSVDTNWVTSNFAGDSTWKIGTTGPAGTFAIPAILSTTAFNGFAIYDSDLFCEGNQVANITTKNPINLSNNPAVMLKFQQYYRRFFDSTFVYVSNNGTTWTRFEVNKGIVNNAFSDNDQFVNPSFEEVNISSVAGGQATVWIRFQFYSPSTIDPLAGCGYAWMIDDVSLEIPPAIEASLDDLDIPESGCSLPNNATIKASITNNGLNAITNFNVTYVLNGGAPNVELISANIAPGASYLHTFATTADFSTAGIYQLEVYISDLVGDANAGNDSLFAVISNNLPIDVTPFYSQGFEPQEDLSGWIPVDVDGDGVTWALVNTFQRSGGFCVRKAGSAAADNDWLFTNCINFTAGKTYNLVFYTKVFDLIAICDLKVGIGTSANEAAMSNILYTRPPATDTSYLQVIVPITVPSTGLYYLGFNAFSTAGTSSIRIDDISLTDGPLGTDNNKLDATLNVFPNPADDKANLTIKSSTPSTYEVRLLDILGREIMSKSVAQTVFAELELPLQGIANGVYTIQVQSGNKTESKKLVINR